MTDLTLTWQGNHGPRLEQAVVTVAAGRLDARGTALAGAGVDSGDGPYRVDYELATDDGYVTRRLAVRTEGPGWRRELDLRRSELGEWTARRVADPDDGGAAVLDPSGLTGALDCDLGHSPLTNAMPVLRHDLHRHPGRNEFVMAWVSVPDLVVHPSPQTYQHIRAGLVRFWAPEFDFTADIEFTPDGFVQVYPEIARAV